MRKRLMKTLPKLVVGVTRIFVTSFLGFHLYVRCLKETNALDAEPRTIRTVVIHVLIGLTTSVAHANRPIPDLSYIILLLLKHSKLL